MNIKNKPFIIGIMGSRKGDHAVMAEARILGKAVAQRGYVLVTGGGPGVMKAASEGAHLAGGLVIGILPNDRTRPLEGYPNEYVDIPVYTGMSDARNSINARTPHVVVALSGGAGTVSEIALALKAGTPVISLRGPSLEVPDYYDYIAVDTVEDVLAEIDKRIGRIKGD